MAGRSDKALAEQRPRPHCEAATGMTVRGLFPTYHPVVGMVYFAAVIIFSFSSTQPVYVAIAAVMACLYLVYLKGWRQLGRQLVWFVPFTLFIALLNSFFNVAGTTVLWRWRVFQLTAEGLAYGFAIGGMLIAVLTWFSCYNEVMTDDKFTYLFGRVAPTLSLAISMISRWVPTMVKRGRVIYDSQEALIGGENGDASKKGAFSRGVRMASVLVGLGMEDSIQTSDSMRARGWGLTRRTSYARYRWHPREYLVLGFLLVMIALNAVLMYIATSQFAYYPTMSQLHPWWGYLPYVAMLAIPFLVELEAVGR